MAEEERDLPDLPTLLTDTVTMHQRFDAMVSNSSGDPDALARGIASFLQNDLMPLLKDLQESNMAALEDLEDAIDPVKIPRSGAQAIADLLNGYKAQNAGNPDIVARVDEALDDLEVDGGDEDEEEEEEQEESGPDDEDDLEDDEDDEDFDDEDDDSEEDEE